jgi:hypothetical protein
MLDACSCLYNLIRNSRYVIWYQLVIRGANTELALFAAAANEQSAYVVNESRVTGSCTDLPNICSVVLIKIDGSRSKDSRDIAYSTLSVFIEAPSKHISDSSRHQSVRLTAGN